MFSGEMHLPFPLSLPLSLSPPSLSPFFSIVVLQLSVDLPLSPCSCSSLHLYELFKERIRSRFPSPQQLGIIVYNGWDFREGHSIKPNSRPSSSDNKGGLPTLKTDHRLCHLTRVAQPSDPERVRPKSDSATRSCLFESSHFL